MALTITEKQHWKNRIESKLNQRIAQLKASDSDLLIQIREQAKREIASSKNVNDDLAKLSHIDGDLEKLEDEKENLTAKICGKLFGEESCRYPSQNTIAGRLAELEEEKVQELFLNHELGRRIVRLKEEMETLSDSVLLAVDIRQVIDLWDRVTALVTAQAIEPEQESLFEETA